MYVSAVDRFGLAEGYSLKASEAHPFASKDLAELCAVTERRRFPDDTHEVEELGEQTEALYAPGPRPCDHTGECSCPTLADL